MHFSTVEAILEYEVREPTHFCFNIEAAHVPQQHIVSEKLDISPPVVARTFDDPHFGHRQLRFDAKPGPLALHYKADVQLLQQDAGNNLDEAPVRDIPDDVFHYLMSSRYCESDLLCSVATKMFGAAQPGVSRVQKVVDWIHANITYRPGSTDAMSTAKDVFVQRAGVCRDFAHLGITFCRALSIPARMVVGYVWFDEPPQDFHAIFEAWVGGRWVLFDPTGMAPADRLVRVGTGRDAKDVAFCTYFGNIELKRKEVMVLEHDPRPERVVRPQELVAA